MKTIICYRGIFEHQGKAPTGLFLDYQYSRKPLTDSCFKRVERVQVTMPEYLTLADLDSHTCTDVHVKVLEVLWQKL